jgi:hypothetical protein
VERVGACGFTPSLSIMPPHFKHRTPFLIFQSYHGTLTSFRQSLHLPSGALEGVPDLEELLEVFFDFLTIGHQQKEERTSGTMEGCQGSQGYQPYK